MMIQDKENDLGGLNREEIDYRRSAEHTGTLILEM